MSAKQKKTSAVKGARFSGNAVVVGAGRSGAAAARLLHALGATVALVERDAVNISAELAAWAQESGVELRTGEHCAAQFAGADMVVTSPGIAPSAFTPFLDAARRPEIIGELQLAFEQLGNEQIIAVTGTSGKTTTVSLMAAMLEKAGKRVFLGGNIGKPLSEYVLEVREGAPAADVIVLEVSSFQLMTCTTFRPNVGVLLNISPNHLDWHADMAEYTEAKFRLFANQGSADLALASSAALPAVAGRKFTARLEIISDEHPFNSVQLLGRHNQTNIAVAYAAVRSLGIAPTVAAQAVAAFKPLPNRLECVAKKEGIKYVNDSKATTLDALRVALNAFDKPVRLLAGGKFKGGDPAVLNELLKKRVAAVYLFGASREIFENAWRDIVPVSWDATLQAAVQRAANDAQEGEIVLLSPATASFDLFKSYEERGKAFRTAVEELK